MAAFQIKENIFSVGVLNPNMRVFDIVMTTEFGTSYNAYLIQGSKKSALIETVHLDFFEDYISNIKEVCNLEQIDYLVMNHNEPDHSGAVEKLSRLIPGLEICISQAGSIYLKNIANRSDLDITVVKDGDSIDLGGKTLRFINAPFLHWPDSMFTYLEEDRILFSCDFLGSHFCEPRMIDTRMRECDRVPYFSAMQNYYDAIFAPFKPYVIKGLEKIKDLPVDSAATSHGPILTKEGFLPEVKALYEKWSQPVSREKKLIPVFYCSAYHNTEHLAHSAAQGVRDVFPDAEVEVYNIIEHAMPELAGLLNSCDACLIGSPTINRDAVPPIWHLLSHIDAVNFAKRPVALFGSYGWSGEALANVRSRLAGLKANVFADELKVIFTPTEEDLAKAREFGKSFAKSIEK